MAWARMGDGHRGIQQDLLCLGNAAEWLQLGQRRGRASGEGDLELAGLRLLDFILQPWDPGRVDGGN